ncbi:MAG: YtxH domain-containing protein [Acidobacteriia bacterium]|nr:YtxH domain-containing protein [Terriglobia bacterium]
MEVRNGRMSTLGSIAVGGLLGAGIALLFAPQSGKRTRRDLRHFGKKVLNKSEAIGMDLCHSVDNLVNGVSEKVYDGVERSLDWTKRATRDVQCAVGSGIHRIRRAS